MANTFSDPSLVSDKARENQVLAYNTTLTSAPVTANPVLRVRRDATTLVDFSLDDTTPLAAGGVDGSANFSYTTASAVAVGGSATIPNNYQVIGRDGVVHLSGEIDATDGISAGQTVFALTTALVAPAS